MLLPQPKQLDLLFERPVPIEAGALDDPLDLLQGKLQFPEQENLLQGFQRRVVIQPVTRFGVLRSPQILPYLSCGLLIFNRCLG